MFFYQHLRRCPLHLSAWNHGSLYKFLGFFQIDFLNPAVLLLLLQNSFSPVYVRNSGFLTPATEVDYQENTIIVVIIIKYQAALSYTINAFESHFLIFLRHPDIIKHGPTWRQTLLNPLNLILMDEIWEHAQLFWNTRSCPLQSPSDHWTIKVSIIYSTWQFLSKVFNGSLLYHLWHDPFNWRC